jgi:hypothetical protein
MYIYTYIFEIMVKRIRMKVCYVNDIYKYRYMYLYTSVLEEGCSVYEEDFGILCMNMCM